MKSVPRPPQHWDVDRARGSKPKRYLKTGGRRERVDLVEAANTTIRPQINSEIVLGSGTVRTAMLVAT